MTGFRILIGREPAWDGQYVVFGLVTSGLDSVRRIAGLEPRGGVPDQLVQIVDCGGSTVVEPFFLDDPTAVSAASL
jgi:cyclophilin family peptidyl-prolyl cis-trans isomerase